jgi:hypothetical protein
MQRLSQVYTQRFNRRHRRVGHVLQGRYRAIVVDAAAYCRFVAQGIGLPSVWEGLRGQMWLGDAPFRAKIERRLGAERRADVSRAQREPARPNTDELLAEVARAFDLPRHAVQCSARPPPPAGVSLCRFSAAAGGERTDHQGGAACRNIRTTGIPDSGRGGKPQGPTQKLLDYYYKVKR